MFRLKALAVALLPLVLAAGCNDVVPTPIDKLAQGTFTTTIVSALALHSYMEPAPTPVPSPTGKHKRSECPTGGWITHGDGHRTPCPDCEPGDEAPVTTTDTDDNEKFADDVIRVYDILANMAPAEDTPPVTLKKKQYGAQLNAMKAEIDDTYDELTEVDELLTKLNKAKDLHAKITRSLGASNGSCGSAALPQSGYGSTGSSQYGSYGSSGSSAGYGSSGSSMKSAYYNPPITGTVYNQTSYGLPTAQAVTQVICETDANGVESCRRVTGASGRTYGVVGYGLLGRPIYGWK